MLQQISWYLEVCLLLAWHHRVQHICRQNYSQDAVLYIYFHSKGLTHCLVTWYWDIDHGLDNGHCQCDYWHPPHCNYGKCAGWTIHWQKYNVKLNFQRCFYICQGNNELNKIHLNDSSFGTINTPLQNAHRFVCTELRHHTRKSDMSSKYPVPS